MAWACQSCTLLSREREYINYEENVVIFTVFLTSTALSDTSTILYVSFTGTISIDCSTLSSAHTDNIDKNIPKNNKSDYIEYERH